MHFSQPLLLGLLALVPLVVALLLYAQHRRHAAQHKFAEAALLPSIAAQERPVSAATHVVLMGLAIALVVIGLAGPQGKVIEEESVGEGIDIVLALDISKSMSADDVYPTRFQVMKHMARTLIDQNPSDRIGLVAFAGEAFVQCPLTVDHLTVKSFVDALTFEPNIKQGTALGDAIQVSLERFDSANSRVIILFTDGESNKGSDVMAAAKAASDKGVKVYTIGIGSELGTQLLEDADPFFGTQRPKTKDGRPVIVKLDNKTLKEIAKTTGGAYLGIGNERDISQAFLELDKSAKTEFSSGTRKVRQELGPLFLLAAAVVLWVDFLVELYRVSPLGASWTVVRARRKQVA